MSSRDELTRRFSGRLVKLLIKNGHSSRSASTGVKVKDLATIAGCSFEMARRYANGAALPDALAIIDIAKWLNVDPGWLLYGERQELSGTSDDPLMLTQSDLKVTLERIIPVCFAKKSPSDQHIEQLSDFFSAVIADFARLNAPLELKMKLLETSISSAVHFLPHLTEITSS